MITFLVIYNEYSLSTSSFCNICLGCEFAEASIHNYNISRELTESISKFHKHIGINKYTFLIGMITCKMFIVWEGKKNLILWCTTTIARVWKNKMSLVCIFLLWHNGSAKSSTHANKFGVLYAINPSLNFYLSTAIFNQQMREWTKLN